MSGMLRQSLANTRSQGNCLDAETIAAYYERSLDASLISKYEAHLAQCAHCRQQIAMMVRAESAVPARAREKSSWIWDWRFLASASAAAALLFLTIWGVRQSTMTLRSPKAPEPLVAMSTPPQEIPLRATTSPKVPAVVPESKSTSPQKLDRISSGRQAPRSEASDARSLQNSKEYAATTTNGQSSDALLKQNLSKKPGTNAAETSPATQSLAAGAAAAPTAALQVPSAPPVSGSDAAASGLGNGPATEAKAGARDEISTTNRAQSAGRISAYAAANQAIARGADEKRSAVTIIATPDPKILWRITSGFVERSEDTGATWTGQLPLPDARLTAGSAPTAKTCWLVGEGGTILLTKDGNHWSKIPPPVPANFVSVSSKSFNSATITASDGQKFSTSDGGKRWTPAQ